MMDRIKFRTSIVLSLGICWLLINCSPKLNNVDPPIDEPESFTATGDTLIEDQWWESFNDRKLNSLIDTALSNNFNLKVAWQRVQAAEAQRKQQSTFLLPSLQLGAQTAASRPEPDFAGGENTQIGGSVNYEVDLWGRIKAATEAEEFNLKATYQDYQAAALSLSAQIARTYLQYVLTDQQLELADQQLATNKKIIQLIRVRFGNGQIKGVDILRQKQSLENTKDLKIIYQTNKQVLANQLAVLVGRSPQSFQIDDEVDVPEWPASPSTGLPLELVRRRPDLQAAYNRLLSADREKAVAVRNKFPRLSFNLLSQARSNEYANVFKNWAYTLGANISAPLLNWGRLRAEVDRTEAVKQQQLYNYGQAVLTAFQEVEDAYVQEKNLLKRLKILKKRSGMAKKTFKQLRVEFFNGMTDYIDVLIAFNEQQQLARDVITIKQDLFTNRVDLYIALAGSFTTDREEVDDLPQVQSKNEP